MEIEFLYYEECSSHEEALRRLERVLAEEGARAQVTVMKVETPDRAAELRFVGSPTIRVNGRDIDQPAPGPPYRLACRAYNVDDGRISPLPPLEMIRQALRAAS